MQDLEKSCHVLNGMLILEFAVLSNVCLRSKYHLSRGTPHIGHSGLADDLGRELGFDDLTGSQGDVVDTCLLARFHDPAHLVVDEVDAGIVVACVAGLEYAGTDQSMIGGSPIRFPVVVWLIASAQKSQALYFRELLRSGVGCSLLEPPK